MMRQALRDSGTPVARTKTLPAPVGGWNTLDSIADMASSDAVFLDNFFPRTTDVVVRKGAQLKATLPAGREIRTLMGYKGVNGVAKLFAAADDGVYDVTAGGSVVTKAIAATLNNWQSVNITTAGGSFLVACNGQDSSMVYDGSQWVLHAPTGTAQTISSITAAGTTCTLTTAAAHGLVTGNTVTIAGAAPAAYNGTYKITVTSTTQFTFTAGSAPGGNATTVGTYTIPWPLIGTGITPTSAVNVTVFKSRVIFCANNSLSFFYLPVNQIAGTASEFPLGSVARRGGYLVAVDSWTLDGGNGPDDYLVAITSEGELLVYKGTDPSSAANFGLVGVFQLAQPLGRKCFLRVAADTLLITRQAIYPLSKSLPVDSTDKRVALSRKIERAWLDATATNYGLFGWQPVLFPEASMLLVNVPVLYYPTRSAIYSHQFVMNLMTGAWCRFTGWHSEAMLSLDGKFYFALHNKVNEGWTGQNDFGSAIQASGKTAFTTLSSSRPKQVTMLRPVVSAAASVSLQLGIDMDFADNSLYSSTASYSQTLTKWDSAVWGQATWNGNSAILAKWRSTASRVGRYAGVRLRVNAKDVSMTWIATDLMIADAGGELL